MSEYGYSSAEDMEKVFKYLKNVDADGTLPYQKEYENLYIDNGFSFAVPDKNEKVWYLTFDDGPNTEVTPKVLDTLKEYGAKATFFVIYRDGEEEKALYKRIVEESHTLGIHSTTHNYTQIYASVESYLENFSKISNHLEEITGLKPEIFRFPGGSVNSYNKSVYQQIIAEMARRGYVYYDWNYSSGDASDPGVSRADPIHRKKYFSATTAPGTKTRRSLCPKSSRACLGRATPSRRWTTQYLRSASAID